MNDIQFSMKRTNFESLTIAYKFILKNVHILQAKTIQIHYVN